MADIRELYRKTGSAVRNAQPNRDGLALQRTDAPASSAVTGLTQSGVVAALLVGVAALSAGWRWATLLIAYFVAATLVTRTGRARKLERVGARLAKTGARDATQVLANGAVFGIAALLYAVESTTIAIAFGVGSLAASSADTWATELGLLSRAIPRSIYSRRRVLPGASGGVTWAGTIAGIAGAVMIAIAAVVVGWAQFAVAVALGGIVGMTVDSVLGAVVQERRWCRACECDTEMRTHSCGTRTMVRGGISGFDNDVVNAATTLTGGLVSAAVWWAAR